MPAILTRADSLREYLTGAGTDGGVQTNPNASFGTHRSATEAVSLGIVITSPIPGILVDFAGGANPIGPGTLTAVDANHLVWTPTGSSSPGPPASFSGTAAPGIVEAFSEPGKYLRLRVTTPIPVSSSTITLTDIPENFFGFRNLTISEALAGTNLYRASMVRNESPADISAFYRWLSLLGTPQVSDILQLGPFGAGTLSTSGSFSDWPLTGWCRIETTGGVLREIVYYSSRTNSSLAVFTQGRALLGSTATNGAMTDNIYPVPGVAVALDPTLNQPFGSVIQSIANETTSPTGVTWKTGIRAADGINLGTLRIGEQVGIWIWRDTPPGLVATPSALVKFLDSFNAM